MKANWIAGQWVKGHDVIQNINPSNLNDIIGEYAQADEAQCATAIAAADEAFSSWSQSAPLQRHAALSFIARELSQRAEEIGTMLAREEGKTKPEGIGETIRAAQIFDFYAGEALRLGGEVLPSTRPGIETMITRSTVGPVGIITPWNFPIAIPAWKIAPAICYGNTVVFKPAELVPGCAWILADIISRSGLPEGVFNLVMGPGRIVGQGMVDSTKIKAISFTGSVGTGQRIAASCVSRMAKFQLEMGGKNPMVVLDDADLDTAVDCAINSAFFSTGQRCTASSRLIVTEGIHDQFVEAMRSRMDQLVVSDACADGTHIGPVVDENQLSQDLDYITIGKDEGANLVHGGAQINGPTPGHYLTPALFTECNNDMRICREEIFGPVASVIRVKDYEEAVAVANDTDFGLSSGICTSSLKYANDYRQKAEAGMVMVNLPTAGVDFHVPFGGTKGSSYGAREQGSYAKEFFTSVKTSYIQA